MLASTSPSPASTAAPMTPVSGLGELVRSGKYQGLLLDQFGVLHDGRTPYPGAAEAVAAAADAGLQLLLISNSSRRAGGTLDKLEKMGFRRSAFAGVVTSGEMAHSCVTQRPDAWWQGLGRRVVHFNWSSRGPIDLQGWGLEVVSDPSAADFFLAHGTEGLTEPGPGRGGVREVPLEAMKELLVGAAEAARRQGRPGGPPPLVVANPDVVTVDGDDLVPMPGALAAAYAGAGGRVVLMGKPAPLIYGEAGRLLGLEPGRLLAVGDSMEHDIAGAASAGMDSLFIAAGIHAREVLPEGAGAQGPAAQAVDAAALRRLAAHHVPGGGGPTWVTTRFVW
ncbi:hypothetical protein HYH03_010507 [Edaphochlamys debaryana]|uniref:Uncharacterized protein n=1 Tax=Edaphochlamys debaryana TaxID=47281 RepID=A0A835XZ29_9CHLO|nr:hypothetical protein HYH03_010507 [Edaphochlamys debaryana]|eukprot:KAG2491061.1 hypothetical protein HYH03_010507 [Edaphochlamys debaryana]